MKPDWIAAKRLVGLLVGVSVAGIPLTLLAFLEPLILPISPLLMTLLMLVLLIGLPLPLLSAVPELAYPRDELSVRNAIRMGQVGAAVLLIAASVAWLLLRISIKAAGECRGRLRFCLEPLYASVSSWVSICAGTLKDHRLEQESTCRPRSAREPNTPMYAHVRRRARLSAGWVIRLGSRGEIP
jgi:hypothetical protein